MMVAADPGFYMVNWLWIGKCHLALGHRQEAKPWLQRVVSYETSLEEELEVCIYTYSMVCIDSCVCVSLQAKKEAESLLQNL